MKSVHLSVCLYLHGAAVDLLVLKLLRYPVGIRLIRVVVGLVAEVRAEEGLLDRNARSSSVDYGGIWRSE